MIHQIPVLFLEPILLPFLLGRPVDIKFHFVLGSSVPNDSAITYGEGRNVEYYRRRDVSEQV